MTVLTSDQVKKSRPRLAGETEKPHWQQQLEGAAYAAACLGVVAVSAGILLFSDYQVMRQAAGPHAGSTPSSVMSRPVTGDQVRPYLPTRQPTAPGSGLETGPSGGRDRDRPRISVAAPMTFDLQNGAVRAIGTITPGTVAAFERFLEREDVVISAPVEVELHSPGGAVDEAIELARTIREKNMHTRVNADHYCASSCPLMFAGGVERVAHKDAWIGVHQAYASADSFGSLADGIASAQRVTARVQNLLNGLDVDPYLWTYAMRTPKQQLYFFTHTELIDYKLATEIEGLDS